MNSMSFRPDPGYRATMFAGWAITTVVIVLFTLPFILFIPDRGGQIVFGVLLAFGLVLMALWALWIPAYCRTLEYSVDADAVRMNGGVFWKRRVTVPYDKITNVDIIQGPMQRMYGIGTVNVQTAGAGGAQGAHAELRLAGVQETDAIRDRILDHMGEITNRPDTSARPPAAPESDVLSNILAELTAVRKLLERGGN